MVSRVSNCLPVQPFSGVVNLKVDPVLNLARRNADVFTKDLDADGETDITLNFTPLVSKWVEVWIDGFRVVNRSYDFGKTFEDFTVNGRMLRFKTPRTGKLIVICDKEMVPLLAKPETFTVKVDNCQGTSGAANNGEYRAALYCEPIAMTMPEHGEVRMTDDRKSLIYIPQRLYEGFDAFSYSVITDRGQISTPACVFVQVGNPKPVKK